MAKWVELTLYSYWCTLNASTSGQEFRHGPECFLTSGIPDHECCQFEVFPALPGKATGSLPVSSQSSHCNPSNGHLQIGLLALCCPAFETELETPTGKNVLAQVLIRNAKNCTYPTCAVSVTLDSNGVLSQVQG